MPALLDWINRIMRTLPKPVLESGAPDLDPDLPKVVHELEIVKNEIAALDQRVVVAEKMLRSRGWVPKHEGGRQ